MKGVVAAGHPVTAQAGAAALRAGGNAVDAAIAAVLASWAAEPLLTGPGAGGYLLVAGPEVAPTLLDFFVAAPAEGERGDLLRVSVDFGDAGQDFHVGGAACGVPGMTPGLEAALARWGTLPLADLAAPAAALAQEGVALNRTQAFVSVLLEGILTSTDAAAARFAPRGAVLREGDLFRDEELAETIERFGAEGAAPFTSGDLAGALVEAVQAAGGTVTAEDLAAYAPVERAPAEVTYRGRRFLTNPPPSAGGALLSLAMGALDRAAGAPDAAALVRAMEVAQRARDADFDRGLAEPGFLERFLSSRLGSTTHVSVLDAGGLSCAVTCTNGEGSGVVVPGTGIHVNNVMGEEDLSPLGFFTAPAGRRMPSMMAPTAVVGEGGVELALGSAGSNRIRSAILQTVVGVVDRGLPVQDAVEAPRVHFEAGTAYFEPGADDGTLASTGHALVPFRDRNLFFGGVQAAYRDPATGELSGAADPRRGGAVVTA